MQTRQVKEIAVSNPILINPDATLQEAAMKMKDMNCGFLPVGNGGEPEGIITDRDIVIRAISEGKNPVKEKVRDYMTPEVCSCSETDSLEDAANAMRENQVSRLVVKDEDGNVCGVLSFGHIIRSNDNSEEIMTVVSCATGKDMAAA